MKSFGTRRPSLGLAVLVSVLLATSPMLTTAQAVRADAAKAKSPVRLAVPTPPDPGIQAATAGAASCREWEIPAGSRVTEYLSSVGTSVHVYHVPLRAGQHVSLTLSAAAGTDFVLGLRQNGASGSPVAQADRSGYPQTIGYDVPPSGSGWYDVVIRAFSGSGRYTLDYDFGDVALPDGAAFHRIDGRSRYDTAVDAVASTFTTASTVVLATGRDFADAIAASGLCGSYGAPLLLTDPSGLPDEVLREMQRLSARKVIIVGSLKAVGDGVRRQLEGAGLDVTRIGGRTRYETAAMIADAIAAHETSMGRRPATEAFLAGGAGFADGIVVAPYAYSQRMPVLLTARDAMPDATESELASMSATRVYVMGGEGAVSAGLYDGIACGKERIFGPNRYATAVAAANVAVGQGWASWKYVGLATGADFPDGLAGGVVAGEHGGVLLLSNPLSNRLAARGVSRDMWDALYAHGSREVSDITVFGGRGAVSGCAARDAFLAAWGGQGAGVPWSDGQLPGSDAIAEPVGEPAPWQGRWLWVSSSSTNQWAVFRRSLTLPAKPTSAIARIATDTKYWLWVNGRLVVFEGGLKRGPNPRDTYYDAVDLAPYLQAGQNVIAVQVWYLGKSGFSHSSSGHGGLLFQADIVSDGGVYKLASDATWKGIAHPGYKNATSGAQPNFRLPESNVYYDARSASALDGWETVAYDDSGWPRAKVVGSAGAAPWHNLLIRPIPAFSFGEYEPYVNAASLPTISPGGTIVAKLPSNLQITPVLTVSAPSGTVIGIQTDHYTDGGQNGVRATYVSRNGTDTFESLGWMSGTAVRYTIPKGVRIIGLSYRESGYATTMSGTFSSSDPFFFRLWQKAARTLYLNMRDSWMDCPTRERAPWGADVVNDGQAGMYAFDPSAAALTAKTIRELAGWQRGDGTLSSPVPGNYGKELPQQVLAAIWSVWPYYTYTGDADTANAVYPAVKKYLSLWRLDSNGLVVHRAGGVDWQDWGSNIDARLLDNAWYAMALQSAIHLAESSGNTRDVPGLRARLSSIQRNFDRRLWVTSARAYRSPGYRGATDDRGNALAVVAGLAPANRYPALVNVLRSNQHASPYLEMFVLRAMYIMGDASGAEHRMRDRYAGMVADPGYTLWENWVKANGTDDHAWSGGPVYALGAYATGLTPTSPGYRSYNVQPQLGTLTSISASAETVRGTLSVAASNTASGFILTVSAPDDTAGSLVVPTSSGAEVSVNGTLVYAHGSQVATMPGESVIVVSPSAVTVRVGAGQWTVASSVKQQAGVRNLSLINR